MTNDPRGTLIRAAELLILAEGYDETRWESVGVITAALKRFDEESLFWFRTEPEIINLMERTGWSE